MTKITSGNGPKALTTPVPERDNRASAPGGSVFRSSIEQSRHAAEAQQKAERAPLPVGREDSRKRRKPPSFDTLETVPFEKALEIHRQRMGVAGSAIKINDEETLSQTAIAVIARDGQSTSQLADSPLLAYSTIFMDGRQYLRWKDGTDPALDREVSKMLSELTTLDTEK